MPVETNISEDAAALATFTTSMDAHSVQLQDWVSHIERTSQTLDDYTIEELRPCATLLMVTNNHRALSLLLLLARTILPSSIKVWTSDSEMSEFINNPNLPVLERNSVDVYRKFKLAEVTMVSLHHELTRALKRKFGIPRRRDLERIGGDRKAMLLSVAIYECESDVQQGEDLIDEINAIQLRYRRARMVYYSPRTGITFHD